MFVTNGAQRFKRVFSLSRLKKKTKGEEVLHKVFQHLNVLEKDYFGLRYIDRNSQSVCVL